MLLERVGPGYFAVLRSLTLSSLILGTGLLAVTKNASGQTLDELKHRLAQREAEVVQLRRRIADLQGQTEPAMTPASVSPARVASSIPAEVPPLAASTTTEEDESKRALERALVREGGLLIPAHSFEIEPNFVYTHQTSDETFRRDAFGPALAFRAGLPFNSQIELAVPYVFESRQTTAGSHKANGFGDLSVGLSHQLAFEHGWIPDVIAAVAYTAPTGRNSLYESALPVGLGSGAHALAGSLTAVKRSDPLVFFGTYTFSHYFPFEQGGLTVEIGNSNTLKLGTILAASPSTSLQAVFTATFFDKTRVGGIGWNGSDEPEAIITVGSSVILTETTALDVSVGAGLTRNSPNFQIGIALPVRF